MPSFFDRWHFHDDAPLSSSLDVDLDSEDTFHRRYMAERLASLLGKKPLTQSQTDATSSFTLAVCGPWGEGKTSLKNLTLRYLQNYNPCPHLVHFNPRQWSNEAAIIVDFFAQLASAVGNDANQEAKEGAKTLRSISELLLQGQTLYTLAAASLTAGLLAPDASHEAKVASAGSAFLAFLVPMFRRKAEALQKGTDEQKGASLTKLQSKAAEQLCSLEKPVVVFVDDLDRLTGSEIALVFQLLKFNADFPNVVYVLLADPVILERGLDTLFPGEGRRYLEKFVQLSLELPQPSSDALSLNFFKALSPIFEELNPVSSGLHNQIRAAYKDVFLPYLPTMRRVQLYVNALHFTLPLGKDARKNIWEIAPFDVFLLELLRAHEPAVYRKIRDNREWLTSVFAPVASAQMVFEIQKDAITKNNLLSADEKEKRVAQLFEQHKPIELSFLEDLLSVAHNLLASEKILKLLFPNLALLFQQKNEKNKIVTGNRPSGAQWDVERRMCSPRRFERYFSAVVGGTTLRQDERDLLSLQRANRNSLIRAIRECSRNGRTDDVLAELENIGEQLLTGQEVEPFITALMDWGDELPLPSWTPSSTPTRILRLCGLVTVCLGKTSGLQEAVDVFEHSCTDTTGFYVPLICTLYNLSVGEKVLGFYFDSELKKLLPEKQQQINERLVAQIARTNEALWKRFDAMIAGNPEGVLPLDKRSAFGPLLWQWTFRDKPQPSIFSEEASEKQPEALVSWASRDAVRGWIAKLIGTPEGFACFAQMDGASINGVWGDEPPFPTLIQLFRTDVIEQTTSVEELLRIGDSLNFSNLAERERKWANTLLDAVRSNLDGTRESIPYFLLGDSTFS